MNWVLLGSPLPLSVLILHYPGKCGVGHGIRNKYLTPLPTSDGLSKLTSCEPHTRTREETEIGWRPQVVLEKESLSFVSCGICTCPPPPFPFRNP